MKERITELLGIRYPILQGGMAWLGTWELAAAVSNGGGLGIIGAGNMPGEVLREQIRHAKAATDKPFGVNLMLRSPFAEECVDVVCEERVPVITTGAGNPGKYIARFRESGAKVIPVVSSSALAKRLEQTGVDALIAEGLESGGHVGKVTTLTLVPQVVDAVQIPVIAAGGIADGRGMLAAFALGAEGIQMGTRFVATTECIAHPAYKEAVLRAKDRSTVVTGVTTGHPVRVIANALSREYEKLEAAGAPVEVIEGLGTGALRRAAIDGDIKRGSVMAGQSAGLVHDIRPAAAVVEAIMAEADALLQRLR
ncbi:MAG: enoyl-[acyl-carrier-protein] reductase FabK [Veillonellaceae bacterium]|nr:enoyl-[acyl-carrier-protein] reductase FabK [Veillonellaceae bacterium]